MAKNKQKQRDKRKQKRADIVQRTGRSPAPQRAAPKTQGALPVLMAPPTTDATRRFTFTWNGPNGLVVIEAYFCVPEGLYRLKSAPTTPGDFAPWARQMTTPGPDGLPERVVVGERMLRRKLWEVRRCVADGRIGDECEVLLARQLDAPRDPPPHPAYDLPLERARAQALSVPELARRPYRLQPFHHVRAVPVLEREWTALGGSQGIVTTAGAWQDQLSSLGRAVADWARQWGIEQIVELLLDAAVFHARHGDPRAAAAFRTAAGPADGADREPVVIDFLRRYVVHKFGSSSPAGRLVKPR